MHPCTGKTALVTSASAGAGRAVAMALAKAGAQVVVHHSRSPAAAEQIVRGIRANGGKAIALAVDLASPDGPQELASRTRAIVGDRLDILVFNARLSKSGKLQDATIKAFDAEFAANVRAPLFLIQQLLPVMNRGSRFVVTLEPSLPPEMTPASSSVQGGLEGLVGQLSPVLASRGIQVDSVIPANLARVAGECPGGTPPCAAGDARAARPSEIARTVTELVSSQGQERISADSAGAI